MGDYTENIQMCYHVFMYMQSLMEINIYLSIYRSHYNLKNPYRIASICYMYIDIGEMIVGKYDGHSLINEGSHRPPNSQTCSFSYCGPYMNLMRIFMHS